MGEPQNASGTTSILWGELHGVTINTTMPEESTAVHFPNCS